MKAPGGPGESIQNPFTKTILEEAAELVGGDRNRDYDHPINNFGRIAAGWSVILGVEVTEEQVALCNIWQKVSRQVHRPKRDNLVDICGYARTIEMLDEERPG